MSRASRNDLNGDNAQRTSKCIACASLHCHWETNPQRRRRIHDENAAERGPVWAFDNWARKVRRMRRRQPWKLRRYRAYVDRIERMHGWDVAALTLAYSVPGFIRGALLAQVQTALDDARPPQRTEGR